MSSRQRAGLLCAGVRYFGVLGVLFGPLGLAYFFEVLTLYRREYGSAHESGVGGAGLGKAAAQPE